MTISRKTALARAAQVKASFPKGPITIKQARAMVMAMADSQVGYTSGNPNWSLYGEEENWPEDWNGRQVYWCALFIAWVFVQCFGAKAARAAIGWQTTNRNWPPAGWTATFLWINWFRQNNRWVGIDNCQSGDISLQSWGRTTKETDHVGLVTGRALGKDIYPGLEGNTSPGSTSAGAGVYRVVRPRWATVGVYRPDWAALVAIYNANVAGDVIVDWTSIHRMLIALGYSANVTGLRNYQKARGLTVDGIPGKNTTAALEADMASLKEIDRQIGNLANRVEQTWQLINDMAKRQSDQQNQLNTLGRQNAQIRDDGPARTAQEIKDSLAAQGFSLDWWIRNGLVLDPTHRQYPADPGSPADLLIQVFEKVTGEDYVPYDGTQKRPIGPGNVHQNDLDVAVEVDKEES